MTSVANSALTSLGYRTQRRVVAGARESAIGFVTICFWLAHIPLALLMHRVSFVSTAHALATLGVGLSLAAFGKRNLFRVACVGGYIAGSEVLWRMAESQVFWEFGKYSTALIFMVALLRNSELRAPTLPLLYFALLLPSAALTISTMDLADARRPLSFNLSGPFALAVCVLFFSQLRLSQAQLQRLFLALTGPLLGIAAIALFTISTSEDLVFNGESNFVTSGGFGPNQVSAGLGLGALAAFLFIVLGTASRKLKTLMFGAMVFMAVQSALTFSRGGLYSAAGAAIFGSVYLLRDARSRGRFLLVAALFFFIASYILLPALDSFTGGALSTRFQDIDSTNRSNIAEAQLRAWSDNPILGVGPGQARGYTKESPHTEFTRLLAEHGSLGLLAMLLLFAAGVKVLRRRTTLRNKALAAAMMGWSGLYMLTAGMRLVAPAFTFGLAFVLLLPPPRLLWKKAHRLASEEFHSPASPGNTIVEGSSVGLSPYGTSPSSQRRDHAVEID